MAVCPVTNKECIGVDTWEYVQTTGDPSISFDDVRRKCELGMALWEVQLFESRENETVPQSDCAMQHLALNIVITGRAE